MTQSKGTVSGSHKEHAVFFYGLSTCVWCRRTRQFLEELGVHFDYVYVDLLKGEERQTVIEEVQRWNAAKSFPTVVIDASQVVVGFKKDELRKALAL